MHKISQLFALTALSLATCPGSGLVHAACPRGGCPNQYAQPVYYQSNQPNTNAERRFVNESDHRYNQLNTQNQNMYRQDQQMMRQGYDPNEGGPGGQPQDPNQPAQPNYRNSAYSAHSYEQAPAQSHYNHPASANSNGWQSSLNGNTPPPPPHGYGREIKVNPNERLPTYDYVLGKDGKWHLRNEGQNGPQDQPGQIPSSSRTENHDFGGTPAPADSNNWIGANDQPHDSSAPAGHPTSSAHLYRSDDPTVPAPEHPSHPSESKYLSDNNEDRSYLRQRRATVTKTEASDDQGSTTTWTVQRQGRASNQDDSSSK